MKAERTESRRSARDANPRERGDRTGKTPQNANGAAKRRRLRAGGYRAVCTAHLTPGAVTQRVERVVRPTREAKDMIARAAEIAAAGKRQPAQDWRVIAVSTYPDQLAELDARVERMRGRVPGMSRSWLIRIALACASDEAVLAVARQQREEQGT